MNECTPSSSSFAGRDNPVVGSMQRRLLVSGAVDFDRAQRRAYLAAISAQVDRSAAAVKPPERGNVTLTSRDGRVPLNISNENLFDVTVRVRFDSDWSDRVLPWMGSIYDEFTKRAEAAGLPPEAARASAEPVSFRYVAALGLILIVVFGLIWLRDRATGGYKVETLGVRSRRTAG